MIIKKIAFGNSLKAHIEDRITEKVNIIFSNDNNKGKTLVMQGLMYSIGYDSIFPSTFNYKDQYFYSKIEINGKTYEFLRKDKSFIVKEDSSIQIFNSVTDFKYFMNDHIFSLPKIIKDKKQRMVDLTLFYEIFFIGQDNRTPSNLISKGQFNKADFKNMIYSYAGFITAEIEQLDIDDIKLKILNLNFELKTLKKKLLIKKNNPKIAEIASKSYDNETFQKKRKQIQEINNNISSLKKSRQREYNRKVKLETLLSELNSLNRNLEVGSVICADCSSTNINYSNSDFTFDVSNKEVRKNIVTSVSNNILQKTELISEITQELNIEQSSLMAELQTTPSDFQSIIVYQEDILEGKNIDDESYKIINEIDLLKEQLLNINSIKENYVKEQKLLLEEILLEMKDKYTSIDPNGNLEFNDLFAKKDLTFSGSEGQEYYFSKLLALNNVLKHNFPLIVDSFRDGELSTYKENKMLEFYKKLNKQVILTSTLKKEEYESRKYNSDTYFNAIDYSILPDCQILQTNNAIKFKEILDGFDGMIVT